MFSGLALVLAVGCGPAGHLDDARDSDGHGAAGTSGRGSDDPAITADTPRNETPTDPGMAAEAQAELTSSAEGAPLTAIQSMQLTRRGGLGFCIDDGQFLTAQIVPGADRLLELSGQVHRGWNDPALTGCAGQACERLEEVGPIQLSSAQQSVLEQLANRLPDTGCPGEASLSCDPCLVANLTVNGATFGGDPCTLGCSGSVAIVLEVGDSMDRWVSH
jgi:hypothetical protein